MFTAEISPVVGRIDLECPYQYKELARAIPGARWDGDRRTWTVPLSWPACLALRSEFSGLTLGPQLKAWGKAMAAHKNWLRSMRGVIADDTVYDFPGFADLYPYQVVGARLIAESKGYLLMDETGVGKTRTALAGLKIADDAAQTGPGVPGMFPCLVVAPKSVLVNWAREIEAFFPDADVRIVTGTPKVQERALEPGGDFYIINYEGLRKRSRVAPFGSITLKAGEADPKELQSIPFRSCIADECHRVKAPSSTQTRALWAASDRKSVV